MKQKYSIDKQFFTISYHCFCYSSKTSLLQFGFALIGSCPRQIELHANVTLIHEFVPAVASGLWLILARHFFHVFKAILTVSPSL